MKIPKLAIYLLLLLSFSLVSFNVFLKKETKNLKIDTVLSLKGNALDLEVNTTIHKDLNALYFTSNEKINQIALYDFEHNLIYKKSPNNQKIFFDNLNKQAYYLTFASENKIAIKTIFLH